MALHRDIYWIGRQWAVTGYGVQLIDQRLNGVFDIEIARLWDESVLDAMRAQKWLKAEDFEKAIIAGHKRFPEPVTPCSDQQGEPPLPVEALLLPSEPTAPEPAELPPLPPPVPQLRLESESAKAVQQSEPALPVETPLCLSEPVAPDPTKMSPSSLELRAESERARADLERKMSALDGLLRSRGFVAAQPVIPPPSILPVRAEGELAKFAPQWRVRN